MAQGILTATGGMTSHAAVVAREMGKPSIVGAGELRSTSTARRFTVKGKTVKEGDWISFDGLTGEVKLGKVASQPSEILQVVAGKMKPADSPIYQRFNSCSSWADKFRRLGVRANADQPDQAELAYAFGAEGIGLCRTEHMFFGEDRIPIVQPMILADNEAIAARRCNELLPMQRADFDGLFKAMEGLPVTIRTLDPPLHEFLPKREDLMVEIAVLEAKGKKGKELAEKKKLLARVEQLHEFNPMLGHRGCVSASPIPRSPRCRRARSSRPPAQLQQGRAEGRAGDHDPAGRRREGAAAIRRRSWIAWPSEVLKEQGVKIKYLVGTMIEVPRAALMADEDRRGSASSSPSAPTI